MYAIHTTPGFIINSRPNGEAGKLLSVFTRDLGLIRASAQGIRLEKSKLRPFIQDYSFGNFSFVKGKEFWRLTNAQEIYKTKSEKELIARIALLLSRLLQGEEPHSELFATIDALFVFVASGYKLDAEELKTLESLIVARILHRLGYIANILNLKNDIESNTIDLERLVVLCTFRTVINQHINKALRESHL